MSLLASIAPKLNNRQYKTQCEAILTSVNPYSRLNTSGHITASGLVIRGDQTLLIFHPYIKQWLQPGGHINDKETPLDAAIREVYEETGLICSLDQASVDPIDIDVHEIAANPKKLEGSHLHIDFLFRLKVDRECDAPESIEKAWFTFHQVKNARIARAFRNLGAQDL